MTESVKEQLVTPVQNQRGGTVSRGQARIPRVWSLAEMFILGALLVVFNFYPQRIGFYVSANAPASFVPLLAPEFQIYMPWLNVWWGLALLLSMAKFAYARWMAALRWADLGVNVLGVCVLAGLVFNGPIIGLNPEWVKGSGSSLLRFGQDVFPTLNLDVKFVLGLAMGGLVIRLFQRFRHTLATIRLDGEKSREGNV